MWEWLKGLFFKNKVDVLDIEEIKEEKPVKNYYNVRDSKGRFCKKGK